MSSLDRSNINFLDQNKTTSLFQQLPFFPLLLVLLRSQLVQIVKVLLTQTKPYFFFASSFTYVSVKHCFWQIRPPIFWIATNNPQTYRSLISPPSPNTTSSSASPLPDSTFSDLPPLVAVESVDTQLLTRFGNIKIGSNSRRNLVNRANILRQELQLAVLTLQSERVQAIIAINSITASAIASVEDRIGAQIDKIEEQLERTENWRCFRIFEKRIGLNHPHL